MNKSRVLILSAYDAISHQLWRRRLQTLFSEFDWTELSLPPRHFAWRIRGNSLLWATTRREILDQKYDLLIATSMVDLSSLRGFVPRLATIPTLLYVHENQFEYPQNRSERNNVEPLLVPLYSAFCADAIAFNSRFNLDSFLKGAKALLERLPEQFPDSIMAKLNSSIVLPVPLQDSVSRPGFTGDRDRLTVVWNHRWEFDKGPELLLAVVGEIASQRLPVQLHVVGQQFREQPEAFKAIDSLLDRHADTTGIERGLFGFIQNKEDYMGLLSTSDTVLSTANHDFQGLAIQEACLMGCVPLTPDALAYPEYIPARYRYPIRESLTATAAEVSKKLRQYADHKKSGNLICDVDLSDYQGTKVRLQYQAQFDQLMRDR